MSANNTFLLKGVVKQIWPGNSAKGQYAKVVVDDGKSSIPCFLWGKAYQDFEKEGITQGNQVNITAEISRKWNKDLKKEDWTVFTTSISKLEGV